MNYTDEFNALWQEYPKRVGNPKIAAYNQYNARLKAGYDYNDMLEGTKKYKIFCDVTGKAGTELVMQAKKFYGRDEWFMEEWEIPKMEKKKETYADVAKNQADCVVPADWKMRGFAVHLKQYENETYKDFRVRIEMAELHLTRGMK